ncbi:MAG: histidine kinase, partial [Methylohalobius sp.]
MILIARDALTESLVKVQAEARPKIDEDAHDVLYAVFADRNFQHFLGLVSAKEIAAKPQWIFADLLPKQALAPVAEDTLLDQVFRRMEQEGVGYLAVIDKLGRFLGAVTRFGIVKALLAENRRLILRLFALQEQERRFLGRELHDELGQHLTALRADLARLSLSCEGKFKAQLEAIDPKVEHLCLTLKRVMNGLYPVVLDQLGVEAGIQELVETFKCHHPQVRFELEIDGDFKDLDHERALCLYRIAQEA